jgi:SAM-dependent methyltransferase
MNPLAETGASAAPEGRSSSLRAPGERPPRASVESFERLYAASPDPWRYDSSEYEREKYAATLAALDGRSYRRALEVGCSIGAFTELLVDRCGALTALDFSARALELARGRLRGFANVEIVEASFPEQAPAGSWDLVVCSEVLYYLDRVALERAVGWLREQLSGGATVLAVDWRGPTKTEPHNGNEVHDLLRERLADWHALEGRQPGYRLDRFDGDDS